MKKTIWFFTPVGAVLALLVLAMSSGQSAAPHTAQAVSQDGLWLSSQDPPEGYPATRLSPPDSVTTSSLLGDETLAPEGGIASFRIAGSTLKPRTSGNTFTVSSGGGCTYHTGGDPANVWNGPLGLPNGSVVDTMRMYYDDTSASNSSSWFTIYDLYGNLVNEWGVSSSGDLGNGFNDTTLIDHTIDYGVYSYVINWRPVVSGQTMQLCGFRIFYTPPPFGLSFLPVSVKD